MDDILKLAKDYSKERHLDLLPRCNNNILDKLDYIYDENWENVQDHVSNDLTDITAYFIGWVDTIPELEQYPSIRSKNRASFAVTDAEGDYSDYTMGDPDSYWDSDHSSTSGTSGSSTASGSHWGSGSSSSSGSTSDSGDDDFTIWDLIWIILWFLFGD